MNFEEFVKPELLILIPVLYVVGIGLKKSKINQRTERIYYVKHCLYYHRHHRRYFERHLHLVY